MRTKEEIIQRLRTTKPSCLSFDREVLFSYLSFEEAKEFLNPEATPEQWPFPEPLEKDFILNTMKAYMSFAWGKVDNHRGISAGRSVEKMETWIWLLGDDEVLKQVKEAPYPQYGAPKLAVVCKNYGFEIPEYESIQNMIEGCSCSLWCEMGC